MVNFRNALSFLEAFLQTSQCFNLLIERLEVLAALVNVLLELSAVILLGLEHASQLLLRISLGRADEFFHVINVLFLFLMSLPSSGKVFLDQLLSLLDLLLLAELGKVNLRQLDLLLGLFLFLVLVDELHLKLVQNREAGLLFLLVFNGLFVLQEGVVVFLLFVGDLFVLLVNVLSHHREGVVHLLLLLFLFRLLFLLFGLLLVGWTFLSEHDWAVAPGYLNDVLKGWLWLRILGFGLLRVFFQGCFERVSC